jgi:hypothetical protein
VISTGQQFGRGRLDGALSQIDSRYARQKQAFDPLGHALPFGSWHLLLQHSLLFVQALLVVLEVALAFLHC